MARNGDLVAIAKLLAARPSILPEQTKERTVQTHDKFHNDKPVVVEAISVYTNVAGQPTTLPPYSVVSLSNGGSEEEILTFDTPGSGDDPENTIYGVLLEECMNGQVGHVQISGRAIVNALVGSAPDQNGQLQYTLIQVGDTVYALDDSNSDAYSGLVSNKDTNNSSLISKIPLGKAITPQNTDSQTIVINLSTPGGNSSTPDVISVHCASTVPLTFPFSTSLTTMDNYPLVDGVVVLMKDQVTQTQNGFWKYNKDAQGNVTWSRTSDTFKQGLLVTVRHGQTCFGLYELSTDDPITIVTNSQASQTLVSVALQFIRIGPDDITVKSASTADETVFANAPQHAEVAMSDGDLYLVKNSSANASKVGVYIIRTSGSWIYLGQYKDVVVQQGALSGRGRYVLASLNVYQGQGAFYL